MLKVKIMFILVTKGAIPCVVEIYPRCYGINFVVLFSFFISGSLEFACGNMGYSPGTVSTDEV